MRFTHLCIIISTAMMFAACAKKTDSSSSSSSTTTTTDSSMVTAMPSNLSVSSIQNPVQASAVGLRDVHLQVRLVTPVIPKSIRTRLPAWRQS